MNAICVTFHLKVRKESQSSYCVGYIKHLRLELDLEALRHFGNVLGHLIALMVRLVGQADTKVIHGCL